MVDEFLNQKLIFNSFLSKKPIKHPRQHNKSIHSLKKNKIVIPKTEIIPKQKNFISLDLYF
jgi:uncharacterized protein (DUF1499 family)